MINAIFGTNVLRSVFCKFQIHVNNLVVAFFLYNNFISTGEGEDCGCGDDGLCYVHCWGPEKCKTNKYKNPYNNKPHSCTRHEHCDKGWGALGSMNWMKIRNMQTSIIGLAQDDGGSRVILID